MVRPSEFAVNEETEVADILGDRDMVFEVRSTEVEVGEGSAMCGDCPPGVVEEDELSFVGVYPDVKVG